MAMSDLDLPRIDPQRQRFPYSIVWTPIPILTWIFPFIGHMGICYSSGVIRDFAGPYYVSEDSMAFGKPTRYWTLDPDSVIGGQEAWDKAVKEASDIYSLRVHNLICDNCHSHVAQALNLMNYGGRQSWSMVKVAVWALIFGKFVNTAGFLKTWAPFLILLTIAILLRVFL